MTLLMCDHSKKISLNFMGINKNEKKLSLNELPLMIIQ